MTRVLVAEDSLTVRKRLVAALEADGTCQVVGEAKNGREAIELCERRRPDVMTLDMMMPTVSGLAVTEHVMAHCPTPILIVSASINRGEAFKTFDALSAGAVDVLEKPRFDEGVAWDRRFVETVKLVSRLKVITHVRGKLGHPLRAGSAPPARDLAPRYRLVALGASTGGPAALLEALSHLPATFPLPILLVLHIGRAFAASFVEWFGGQLAIPVAMATDGVPLPTYGQPGLFMAPPERHLTIRGSYLRLTSDPERHSCRPSVDVLFESVAAACGDGAIGCLLSGMGKDGAEGLLAMRRAGGVTLVQDEATSAVFGMPREAIALSAAQRILPAHEIGPTLAVLARNGAGR